MGEAAKLYFMLAGILMTAGTITALMLGESMGTYEVVAVLGFAAFLAFGGAIFGGR